MLVPTVFLCLVPFPIFSGFRFVCSKWRRRDTPPCRAPGCSYTPVAALSTASNVSQGRRSYTPLKGPVAPHPGPPLHQGKETHPKKPPPKYKDTNSLRQLFCLFSASFTGKRGGEGLCKLFRNCLCKLCFFFVGWVVFGG